MVARTLANERQAAASRPAGKSAPPRGLLDQLALSWDRFELDNGLRVIVHEDRRAPLVAVSLTYMVGAKDDPPGRSGFAHLFEHLMFSGTPTFPGPYITRLMTAGAVRTNAQTSPDITRYHELVPSGMLDFTLFAEADRMAWFRHTLDPELFSRQREIVLQEKLERESRPFGLLTDRMNELLYPAEHPYRHSVIGSVADLHAATVEEAQLWAANFYGPSNAVLVIAGDVNMAELRGKVADYFGGIAPCRPHFKTGRWVPAPSGRRATLQDRGAMLPHHSMAWPAPDQADEACDFVAAAAGLLGGSAVSPLYRALVEVGPQGGEAAARQVSAMLHQGVISGHLRIDTGLAPGAAPRDVECRIQDEIFRFLAAAAPEAEFDRFRRNSMTGMLRGLENIETKAWLLSSGEVDAGNPGDYLLAAARMADISAQHVIAAARPWLTAPPCVIDVAPVRETFMALPATSRPVPAIKSAAAALPVIPVQNTTLDSGLKIVHVSRPGEPGLVVRFSVDSGYADEPDSLAGAATLLGQLPRFGAGEYDPAGLAAALQAADLSLSISAGPVSFVIQITGLAEGLLSALNLLGDLVLRPRLAEPLFGQMLDLQKKALLQSLSDSSAIAALKPLRLLFGDAHPLARMSLGTEAALQGLTPKALRAFHTRLLSASGATLMVAGDVYFSEILYAAQEAFRGWAAGGEAAKSQALPQAHGTPGRIALLPGGEPGQVRLAAIRLLPPVALTDRAVESAFFYALGGAFGSRLNMRLRELHRWTYGVQMRVVEAGRHDVPRHLSIFAQVDEAHAIDAMLEIQATISEISSTNPVTITEIAAFKNGELQQLMAIQQNTPALLGAIDQQSRLDQTPGDWSAWLAAVHAVDCAKVRAFANGMGDPAAFCWAAMGDIALLERQFAARAPGLDLVM